MKVCLMGVGNVLMGDDALGPWIIESLQAAFEFPAAVTLLDAGASGLDLTLYLDGFDALVAVDALKAAGAPGEVRVYRRPQLLAGEVPVIMTPHEPSLREALMRLQVMGRCPADVVVVGAIPKDVDTGARLSDPVRRAIPEIEAQVLRELHRLGVQPKLRPAPQAFSPWWERSGACA